MSPIIVAGVAVLAFLGLSSGGSSGGGGLTKPAPKRVGRRLNAYQPATLRATAGPGAAPPERAIAPDGLTWKQYSGALVIGSIRKPTRDVEPGFDTIDLAEVYSGGGPVRVLADAYVIDNRPGVGSTARAVANVAIVHLNSGVRLDASQATEQAERIVRDFTTSNDGLVEGEQTTAMLEHNEADVPLLPGFYGDECRIGRITAEDSLYHYDDCRGDSREREGKPDSAYAFETEINPGGGSYSVTKHRAYNLSLEARADGKVYLTARIMRLPARQHLAWRAYVASQPL